MYQSSEARSNAPPPFTALVLHYAYDEMADTTAAAALSMKLLIDGKAQRVLFAEASKEVVDFLFSLLALPVATAVKLIGQKAMVGCVGNLYASVDKLDSTYVQAGAAKDALLCPTVLSPAAATNSSLLRLPAALSSEQPKSYFRCGYGYGCNYVTDGSGTPCPGCRNNIQTAVTFVPSSSGQKAQEASTGGAKGFVQGIVTYTVLDDLTVTPMSTISGITLLNTFAVRDLGDLQEKNVQLGYNEGLAILKASLQSKTVLSDVFLHKSRLRPRSVVLEVAVKSTIGTPSLVGLLLLLLAVSTELVSSGSGAS